MGKRGETEEEGRGRGRGRRRVRDVDEFRNSGRNLVHCKDFWKRKDMGCSTVLSRKGGYG